MACVLSQSQCAILSLSADGRRAPGNHVYSELSAVGTVRTVVLQVLTVVSGLARAGGACFFIFFTVKERTSEGT